MSSYKHETELITIIALSCTRIYNAYIKIVYSVFTLKEYTGKRKQCKMNEESAYLMSVLKQSIREQKTDDLKYFLILSI